MDVRYVIVQAGGKGARMEILTRNKPKALVPINNLPMIFHLFRKFPTMKFIVIGDYKYDVLNKYLATFAEVDYTLVCSAGETGTCAGISEALSHIPEHERFMLIWCDLILSDDYTIPETDKNVIGIAGDFSCRWSYENGAFAEKRSEAHGVAGHFIFREKSVLSGVPDSGEFVKWLQSQDIDFEEQVLRNTKEYGVYNEWKNLPRLKCRPFNKLTVEGNKVIKEGIDEQGRELAKKEVAWYKKIQGEHFENIPRIYEYEPLTMEFIDGKNVYEYTYILEDQKKYILRQIVDCLKKIHALGEGTVPSDRENYYDAYIGKTYNRLAKVKKLVPFAEEQTVVVNGRKCRNIFFHQAEVEKMVMAYMPVEFKLIHGDCTFSNTMLRNDSEPVLIDPRGYFGKIEFFGDPAYDWVKLYYSLVSNYDQFNLKRFNLHINGDNVEIDVASNNWEMMEEYFFELLEGEVTRRQMKILLALTWLSLTTYAWEDYDSICGAFYIGLYHLEEALQMESAYSYYFEHNMSVIDGALRSINMTQMDALIDVCFRTLKNGKKVIVSGLGKNVPICEKFVGTLLSLGLNAGFLHTNSAVHGDMGMVRPGDLVIVLTKSGSTAESIYLVDLLRQREGVTLWLLSFSTHSALAEVMQNKLIVDLSHEGDLWNIMPNNSTVINLLILQTIAMQLAKRLSLSLEKDFKPNHPGGMIGVQLSNEL